MNTFYSVQFVQANGSCYLQGFENKSVAIAHFRRFVADAKERNIIKVSLFQDDVVVGESCTSTLIDLWKAEAV